MKIIYQYDCCFFCWSDITGYIIKHDEETMFGENLHNVTDLSWTYNGTMTTVERADLVRESGIEVEIILHTANLVPRFKEDDAEFSDSAYHISELDSEQQSIVDNFTRNYCRYVKQ